jgi:hypothetical protein
MRKTLIAVAFAGAALAPAAAVTVAATVAATVAPTAAVAAPRHHLVQHRRLQIQRPPLIRRPTFHPTRRCVLPRVSVRQEMNRLHLAGYRNIHYAGRTYYRPRCAMFIHFNACRGLTRYHVMVRYIHFRRFVIALNKGRCVPNYRLPYGNRHRHS